VIRGHCLRLVAEVLLFPQDKTIKAGQIGSKGSGQYRWVRSGSKAVKAA
jgi:hypothetical protein